MNCPTRNVTLLIDNRKPYFSYLLVGELAVIAAYVLLSRCSLWLAPVKMDE